MQVITDFINKYHLFGKPITIGVSGGADSLALALMLRETLPQNKLVALTVNHGLRATSAQEAEYVAQVMKRYDIEHHILVWEGEKPTAGIEEQARLARYRLLCDWCKTHDVQYLAIAHHLIDQAETFLMRLQRGSGLFGLSAIQEVSKMNGIILLRPLLHTTPQIMKSYLEERHIDWVEDESNQCSDFLRVRIRQFLPLFVEKTGITPARIDEAVYNLQKARQFIESTVTTTIEDSVYFYGNCGAAVDYMHFINWHEELKFYVLSKLLTDIGGGDYVPEADALLELIKRMHNNDFTATTLGGVYIEHSGLKIWLVKEYRHDVSFCNAQWDEFIRCNPEYNGIKLPYKLKIALISEK